MQDVLLIKDLETLKVLAEPTRVAILELLTEPRTVSQLAEELGVPRTRLYHHIDLLLSKGLIEVREERRVGALTERVYGPTARVYRPDPGLLTTGDRQDRVEATTTLLFDTTKSDFRRSLLAAPEAPPGEGEPRTVGAGRSVAMLTPAQAAEFIAEVEALAARFDRAHDPSGDARPHALVWALYPSSRTLG